MVQLTIALQLRAAIALYAAKVRPRYAHAWRLARHPTQVFARVGQQL